MLGFFDIPVLYDTTKIVPPLELNSKTLIIGGVVALVFIMLLRPSEEIIYTTPKRRRKRVRR